MIEKLEQQRLTIQAALDAEKTSEERNRMGQFATPSPLARDILAHARELLPPKTRARFLDPALGSGAFYAALRRVFKDRDTQDARAYEIDPHYGHPAAQLWEAQGVGSPGTELEFAL